MAGKSINELTEITNIPESSLMALSADGDIVGKVSASTLKTSIIGQHVTNYIKSIQQNIKLELNSGTLTLKQGSVVYVPNGLESGTNTPQYSTINVTSDITLSQVWSSEEVCMLFLNSDNTLNIMALPRCVSGSSDSATGTNHFYYNTTANTIRFVESDETVRPAQVSLPLAIIRMTGNNALVDVIDCIFNGFGYCGQTFFALPGIVAEIPNGKSNIGVLQNTELSVSDVRTVTMSSVISSEYIVYLTTTGIDYIPATNYTETYTEPTNKTGYALWLNKTDNFFYIKNFDVSGSTWTKIQIVGAVCKAVSTSGLVTQFTSKEPLTLLDTNTLDTIPHIIETWTDGTSWYRVWSDGWCEQGGHFSVIASAALYTVTMFKPYLDTNYNLQITLASTYSTLYTDGASPRYDSACNKTTISFQTTSWTDQRLADKDWRAAGYIW